jgi:hypothetical protein
MPTKRPTNGPVSVRRYDPGTGWTLEEARQLLDQGYSAEHVESRTGWPRPMLIASPRNRHR